MFVGQVESPPTSRSAGETEGVLFASAVRGKTLNSPAPNLTQPVHDSTVPGAHLIKRQHPVLSAFGLKAPLADRLVLAMSSEE